MKKEIRIKSEGKQANLLKHKLIKELKGEFNKRGIKIIDKNKKNKGE